MTEPTAAPHPDPNVALRTPPDGIRPSSFLGLIDDILRQHSVEAVLADQLRAVRETLTNRGTSHPFLSVLLRTQGQRIEPLKDALLCLSGQTDEDFEVILIDHAAPPEAAAEVRRIVDQQRPSFRDRITVVEVQGGSRARPLNVAVGAARGRYIAVYDDDDLVFGNWVEEFHKASERGDGRLIRSIVATQQVRPETWSSGAIGFRSLNWPKAEYAKTFDQLAHLRSNHSPFMSWAFPSILFSKFGLEFDEKLSVCEDWDMILRGSLLCGVDQADALTAVYRRWEGASSSYTIHSTDAWRQSEARVIHKLNRGSVIFPAGTIEQIRSLIGSDESARQLQLVMGSWSWRLTKPIRLAKVKALTLNFYADRARKSIRRRLRGF